MVCPSTAPFWARPSENDFFFLAKVLAFVKFEISNFILRLLPLCNTIFFDNRDEDCLKRNANTKPTQ